MIKKSIKVNALMNILRTLLSIVFPLISYPYVSRVLKVDNLGRYNFSYSIVSYFLLIAGLGVGAYAVREGSSLRENNKKLSEFASQVFSINIFSTVISYVLLIITILTISRINSYKIEILILSTEILFSTLGVYWIFTIFEEFTYVTVRSFIIQLISLLMLFVFVKNENDLYKYICIMALNNICTNTINYAYAKKFIKLKLTFKIDREHWKPIFLIFAINLAMTIYVSSDTTMLGFFCDDYTVGIYGVSSKIYTIIKNVIAAAFAVMIPRFSGLARKDDLSEFVALLDKATNLMTLILIPCSVGMIMMSEEIVQLVSGASYLQSAGSLRILGIAILFSQFAYLFTQCVILPFRKDSLLFKATIVSAAANAILNLAMIPLLNEIGAALTTVIAELIVLVYVCKESRRNVPIHFDKNNIISIAIGVIAIVMICIVEKNLIGHLILRTAGCIILSTAGYAIVLVAMRNKYAIEAVEEVKKKLLHRNK